MDNNINQTTRRKAGHAERKLDNVLLIKQIKATHSSEISQSSVLEVHY